MRRIYRASDHIRTESDCVTRLDTRRESPSVEATTFARRFRGLGMRGSGEVWGRLWINSLVRSGIDARARLTLPPCAYHVDWQTGFPLHFLQRHRCVFSLGGFRGEDIRWDWAVASGASGGLREKKFYLNSQNYRDDMWCMSSTLLNLC